MKSVRMLFIFTLFSVFATQSVAWQESDFVGKTFKGQPYLNLVYPPGGDATYEPVTPTWEFKYDEEKGYICGEEDKEFIPNYVLPDSFKILGENKMIISVRKFLCGWTRFDATFIISEDGKTLTHKPEYDDEETRVRFDIQEIIYTLVE